MQPLTAAERTAAPVAWTRAAWMLPRVAAGVVLVWIAAQWAFALAHGFAWGGDFGDYRNAAARWLAGGSFYAPWQLAGHYHIDSGAILYPPAMLVLLVPFTVLPAVLWWLVPLGTLAAVVVYHRPRAWAWPLLLLPFAFYYTDWLLINGTPTIWIVAAVALGTLRPWLTALVWVKPSVFPFALAGLRDPRWWAISIVVGLACLPLLEDWITALRNSDGSLLYSLNDVPLLLVPVIAWLASPRRGPVRLRPR